MSNSIVAKRYAVALFEICKEKNILDAVLEDARTVTEVFSTNTELLSFLKHPKISIQQKQQLLTEVFSTISIELKNTLMLMIERKRLDEIAQMAADLVELSNEET